MRIVHLIESNSINHIYRYVQEFVSYTNDEIIVLNDTITPNHIMQINMCDCVFIHSLPNNK